MPLDHWVTLTRALSPACSEGELLTRPQYETRYGASFDPTAGGEAWFTPYAARLPDGRIVDAIAARGVLACANDPRDRAKVRN